MNFCVSLWNCKRRLIAENGNLNQKKKSSSLAYQICVDTKNHVINMEKINFCFS